MSRKRRRGIIEFDTHDADWRAKLEACDYFVALVDRGWGDNPFCRRQLAYARAQGKRIAFLVQPGVTPPPPRPGERVYNVETPEEEAQALYDISQGKYEVWH